MCFSFGAFVLQVPLGTGIAFALQYMNKLGRVCVIVYGDGAANQGQVDNFHSVIITVVYC